MKRIIKQIVAAGALLTGIAGHAQTKSNFVLAGTLVNMRAMPGKLYLVYDSLANKAPDSSLVKNGKYSFSGALDFPCRAYLCTRLTKDIERFAATPKNTATFFLDKGNINAVSVRELPEITVTGSAADKDFGLAHYHYNRLMDTVKNSIQKVVRGTDNDWLFINAVTETMLNTKDLGQPEKIAFLRNHATAAVNPYILQELLAGTITRAGFVEMLDSFYKAMPPNVQQSRPGQRVGVALQNQLKAAIGHKAADFALQDSLGHSLSLAAYKGKYVLVQFWNNNDPSVRQVLSPVLQAHKTYSNKGFEVIAISTGVNENDWINALRNYQLPWVNVRDSDSNNTVKTRYGFSGNQSNVLIDPGGTIIARNLSNNQLGEKLSSIFE